MKISHALIAACLVTVVATPGRSQPAAGANPITVAVLDFESTEMKLKEPGAQLALLLTTKLSAQDDIITVERADLAKLLGEQELGGSGLVNPASAAKIGQLTGARVLVSGRLFSAAGEMNLVLKVMSTETSRVFGLSSNYAAGTPPAEPIEKLAASLAVLLREKRASLIANVPTLEDRVARIKQRVAGHALPTVSISIPEQHIGSPVVDPAAETEIGLILSQAGFALLSGEGAARADYHVTGEAFSEAGVRRGNFVSCRARVEVKAMPRIGGAVAFVDRQTTVAVDTAEHMAGKLALQAAGAELADRLAAALVAAKN